jgi:hypothetical protein
MFKTPTGIPKSKGDVLPMRTFNDLRVNIGDRTSDPFDTATSVARTDKGLPKHSSWRAMKLAEEERRTDSAKRWERDAENRTI